jgi:hypothetical protein
VNQHEYQYRYEFTTTSTIIVLTPDSGTVPVVYEYLHVHRVY